MLDILNKASEILPVLLVALGVMSGIKLALEKIKDITASKTDDKLFELVSKVISVFQKIVDFLTANLPHNKK